MFLSDADRHLTIESNIERFLEEPGTSLHENFCEAAGRPRALGFVKGAEQKAARGPSAAHGYFSLEHSCK
jgi:hypothetical protein